MRNSAKLKNAPAMPFGKRKGNPLTETENYIAYLKKKLASENYKANVSKEEYEKEKGKYDKAKLKLKFLKQDEN